MPLISKKGVDQIVQTRDAIPSQARPQYNTVFDNFLKALADKKDAAGAKELADYARSKMTKQP
jgi:aminopeptidase N